MKVIALKRLPDTTYADCSVYKHDYTKDDYENAFLISNQTTFTVLYIDFSVRTVNILNDSGIATVIADFSLLQLLIGSQYTYDFENDVVYLHDYSYYINNEIRTEQYWLYYALKDSGIQWNVKHVGPLGIQTQREYNFLIKVQNTATDDDIFMEYIYEKTTTPLDLFIRNKVLERVTKALNYDRLSNRIFREKIKMNFDINVGPRNESMYIFLKSITKHYSANIITWKNIISLPQSKYSEAINTQFDIGQYKNMCNFLAAYYRYITVYGTFPETSYILGSAPGVWIKDLRDRGISTSIETWDALDTEYSHKHHKSYFYVSDINKLRDRSILYIDIRTDRGSDTWQKWRKRVENETINNIEIALAYLQRNKHSVVCVKMTAMDLTLPITTKLLHFPTTRRRSEWYALMEHDDILSKKVFFPKGTLYAFINSFQTDNVFISDAYKIKPSGEKKKNVLALYALSNSMNVKSHVIDFINNTTHGLFTVRLNNTFDNVQQVSFKSDTDNLYLPSDFPSNDYTTITSYKGITPFFGLSTTYDIKPTGNNHIFVYKGVKIDSLDKYANHMGISRRAHQIRFSEAATALSGYIYRDLVSQRPILNFAQTDNAVSGHLYNALVYYRYNYTFDIMKWLQQHLDDEPVVSGGKYEQHTDIQILNSCNAAKVYMQIQNDLTGQFYVSEIVRKFEIMRDIMYADSPNYCIAVELIKDIHITVALLETDERYFQEIHDILYKNNTKLKVTTTNVTSLGDHKVLLVDGLFKLHDTLYLELQRCSIPSAQRRAYVPHISGTNLQEHTNSIFETQFITLKRIKGDVVFRISMV